MLQAADLRIPLNTPFRDAEVLFSDANRHVAGVLETQQINQASADLTLYDLQNGENAHVHAFAARRFSPCPRHLGPDGKYFSQTANGDRLNVWELGNEQPVVPDWMLPKAKPAQASGPISTISRYSIIFHSAAIGC